MPIGTRTILSSSRAFLGAAMAWLALAGPARAAPDAPPADAKEEANARYRRGRDLYNRGEWESALPEFVASRTLRPNWAVTSGVAFCLVKLRRYDEALEMFESVLREYGGELSPQTKADAQAQIDELRGHVGALEVDGAEPGATITVDGRGRGTYPLSAPLRLAAGIHVVLAHKDGFEPYATSVEVAAERPARVDARMRPLTRSGHLRIAEEGGHAVDVVVDGTVVGKAPWEGSVAPGGHSVALRGEGMLGTSPVRVIVDADQTTPLTLMVEELAAGLRIQPVPVNADVAIDNVAVGQGIWDGRLSSGAHRIEVSAAGFMAKRQEVNLRRGEHEKLVIELPRDLSSPLWRRPARFMIEAAGAAALTSSFGGDIANGCSSPCSKGVGAGEYGVFHVGYELGVGFGFGLTAGYVQMRQTTTDRPLSWQIRDIPSIESGTVTDAITARGFLAGAWAGFSRGERFRIHVRLGVGGVFGSVSDTRTGKFVSDDSQRLPNDLGPTTVQSSASFVYVAPELRAGVRLGEHLEVTAGLSALLLVGLQRPVWTNPTGGYYAAGQGSNQGGYFGTFPAESLIGQVLPALLPGLGARYDF